MKYSRLKFSKEASIKLVQLKGRTGLTPNILSRIGFMMSLIDPLIPNPDDYPSDGEREIDRQVLTGYWDTMFVVLLKERVKQDGFDEMSNEEALFKQFRAHMNRGVLLLHKRIRNLGDLVHLMPTHIYNLIMNEESEVRYD
jgi:DNA sulfur modification protein DndE